MRQYNTIAGGRSNKLRPSNPSRLTASLEIIGGVLAVSGFYFLLPLLLVL